MNEELTIAIDELRASPSDRAWFIPILFDNSPIPSRSITRAESLSDIQFVKLYENWEQGIEQLMRVLDPFAQSIPALINALKDRDVDVRVSAADALGRIGRPSAEAVPALIVALNDDDARVRRNAAGALAKKLMVT